MTMRRLAHPLLFVAFVALLVLSAKLGGAQTPAPTVPSTVPQTITRHVAVATRALPRGAVLSADDFEFRDSTMRAAAPFDSSRVTAGWTTRRAIAIGEILRTPAVEAPNAVTANSPVQVEWADKNISLTVRGVAARNGSVGDRVSVRTETGKRIEATVVGQGRVRIN